MVAAVRWVARGVFALVLTGGTPAGAAVTVPGCEALLAWSATVDLADKSFAFTPSLSLPGALADDKLAPVFGAPLLQWDKADTSAVAKAMKVCTGAAKKARDTEALTAYGNGYNAIAKSIPYALKTVERARHTVGSYRAALDGQPDSPAMNRALGAILDGAPGAPDEADYQGLPREILNPAIRLAKDSGQLPAADRAALHAALSDRRTRIQAAVGGDARQRIAAASADIPGLFALMDLRWQVAGVDPAVDAAIGARADEIRAGLKAASPAQWMPPSCTDLYTWAGQYERSDMVTLGRYRIAAVFADDRMMTVFNLPLAAWGDADMANMKTLQDLCMRAWQALPDAQQVTRLADDTSELVKLASKGRWVDNGDNLIQQARQTTANVKAAEAGVAAALAQIEGLPATTESLQPLQELQQQARNFQALDDDAMRGYNDAVQKKRNGIFAAQLDDALAALKQVEVSKLDDLPQLVNVAQRAGGGITEGNARQRFRSAYELAVGRAVQKVAPAFQAELDKLPVSRDGLRQTGNAVARLIKVTGTERAPAFGALHLAARQRALDIIKQLSADNCAAALEAADIDEDDGAQKVWGEGKAITLGELVCAITAAGNPVAEYDGAGMLSSTHELKVTLPEGGLHTVSLREAEVAAGEEMLVGFELADANGKKPLSVQDWQMFVAMTTAERFTTRSLCQPVLAAPEDGLSVADRFLATRCAVAELSGNLY